jgi:type I restriction enzyme S subunit
MGEWRPATLGQVLTPMDQRAGDSAGVVLSVTERRGIIPQTEVFKKRIATDNTSTYKVLEPLDIAFNPYLVWAGAVGQWKGDEPGVTSPVYEVFRPSGDAEPRYPGILLESGTLTPYFEATASGTVQRRRRTTRATFLQAPIVLPPRDVQRRIVDIVDAVDVGIAALRAMAEHADTVWWRLARAMEGESLDVETVPVGSICDISGGLTKNAKDLSQPDLVEVPYLRVANVHRRRLDLDKVATIAVTRRTLEKLRLRSGDILMNEGGDKDKLGRGAVWEDQIEDCVHQNHVFRLRVTDPRFDPRFISAWSNSFGQRWFETYGTQTTGIASISKTTLSRFPVPVISRERQVAWCSLLGEVDAVLTRGSEELERLVALRAAILPALLSGHLEVPESYDELVGAL